MPRSESDNLDNTLQQGVLVSSDFKPAWWAKNRHIQTIWPRFLQRRKALPTRTERLELPDGDFIDLAWAEAPPKCKGISVLFHGLEGSVRSHYANDMMSALQAAGWWPVLMHFRGCSGEMNRLPRAYHSGDTEDAIFFLEQLNKRFPGMTKVALGFSLGGNMLLKLLGENANQNWLKAAVAISAPLKLSECAATIGEGFSWVYQNYLLNSLKDKVKQKMQLMDFSRWLPSVSVLSKIRSFKEFDQAFTAPIHGFDSAEHYYQMCSAIRFLPLIATPTLILHAVDDPFMNPAVVPSHLELAAKVRLELSEQGGHVGFMQGSPWQPKIWTHERVSQYFEHFA